MSKFITALVTKDITDSIVELVEPLVYYSDLLNCEICAPVGFQSDGASVPRLPIIYTLYGNRAHMESVLHDMLYRVDCPWDVTRRIADLIFFEAMTSRGKPAYIRYAMYKGVRLGGWASYEKRKMLDKLS